MRLITLMRSLLLAVVCIMCVGVLRAGDDPSNPLEEKIPVELKIRSVGRTELFILKKDRKLYLPLGELFRFLRINYTLTTDHSSISGFFSTPDSTYSIDTKSGTARLKEYLVTLTSDKYIITTQDLFIETSVLRDLFRIESTFDSRRLTMTIRSDRALPLELEVAREKYRQRLLLLQDRPSPVLTYKRTRAVFGGTRVDYRLSSTLTRDNPARYGYVLGLGGQLIGGDYEMRLRGFARERLRENNVNAFIRYPFFDDSGLRQIIIGDLADRDVSFGGRVRGVEITNRPAARRLILGSENFSVDVPSFHTVEFYEGGVLRSYVQAERDTTYNLDFEVPYGISDVEFRTYDQWGGSSARRFRYNIPQVMVPSREVQYSLRGGVLRGFQKQKYGRGSIDFGASEHITLGGDILYLRSSDGVANFYPAVSATARFTPNFTGDFTFSPLVSSRISLSMLFPSQAFGLFTNTRYKETSPFNLSRVLDQNTLAINIPVSLRASELYFKTELEQTRFSFQRDQSFSMGVAGYSGSWRFDLTNSMGWSQPEGGSNVRRFWTIRANSSFRMPSDVILQLSTQYDQENSRLQDFGAVVNRAISSDLLITASYTHTFEPSFTFVRFQLIFDLPFVRAESRALRTGSDFQFDQTISGSVVTSSTLRDIFFEDRQRLGRGALAFRPFLDQNGNGQRDGSEQYLADVMVKTFGPKLTAVGERRKDGLLIPNAEAYQEYVGYIPAQSFEDPHWVPRYASIAVMAEPNVLRPFELPIVVGGIVSGRVVRPDRSGQLPVEGLTVLIENSEYKKKVRTFSTGEFNFIGVPPGSYTVSVAEDELDSAGLKADQASQVIEIHVTPEGDVISNVTFTVGER